MSVYRRYSYPPLKRIAPVFYSLPAGGAGGLTEAIAGTVVFSADLTRKVFYNRSLTGAI